MKLEVGKYYRTRCGQRVFIIGISPMHRVHPFIGVLSDHRLDSWKKDGSSCLALTECADDIIEEWREPDYQEEDFYLVSTSADIFMILPRGNTINDVSKIVGYKRLKIIEGEGMKKVTLNVVTGMRTIGYNTIKGEPILVPDCWGVGDCIDLQEVGKFIIEEVQDDNVFNGRIV